MRLIARSALIEFASKWPSAVVPLTAVAALYNGEAKIKPATVSSKDIYKLLKGNAPEALTNREISEALGYSKDHANLVSGRLSSFVRRNAVTGIVVVPKGDRLAWAYRP